MTRLKEEDLESIAGNLHEYDAHLERMVGASLGQIACKAAGVDEALNEDAETVCVCCPYCMTMFEDGLKDKNAEEKVKVLDLAEIVARALK